jgi:hypothetical protein
MNADWIQRWMDAEVPYEIINRFYDIYGAPPSYITEAIIEDEFQAGIGPIKLGTSEAVKRHDLEMLLAKLGYPITSNAQTQGSFLGRSLKQTAEHLYLAPRDLVFGVIGASVGAVIWVVRDIF